MFEMDFARQFKQAVARGDADALRRLFMECPDLKSRINDPLFAFDSPAIVAAAGAGNRDLLEALLDLGADINARSGWWAGSFGVLDNDRHDLVPWLLERGAKLDAHAAARHFMLDELHDLITANPALVNARGGDGQTPLHVASSVPIAALLLDRGAEIDALDIDHESAPARYLIRSHPEIVRYLIDRGCKTDILMESAVGDLDRLRKRLDAEPESIRTQVNNKYFPMHNPRAGGTIYIWTLGLNHSPHRVASNFGHPAVLEFLLERTPPDLKLSEACLTGDSTMVKTMLAHNPNEVRAIAQANPGYISAAAQDNNTAAVRLMLESGWPVLGDGRHTPLHFACWHGNAEMVRAILPFHPPLEALDADHHATPLGWTIHGSENGPCRATGDYAGTVQALLEAGAKRPEKIEGSEAVRAALAAS
jgi:ankyrin repeat protein